MTRVKMDKENLIEKLIGGIRDGSEDFFSLASQVFEKHLGRESGHWDTRVQSVDFSKGEVDKIYLEVERAVLQMDPSKQELGPAIFAADKYGQESLVKILTERLDEVIDSANPTGLTKHL